MKVTIVVIALATALALQASAQSPKLTVLHNFGSSNDGNVPSGPLLLDALGNLYGVTGGGPGEYGNGLIFELTSQPDGDWREAILHTFSAGNDGAFPWGALVADASGNLYGTLEGSPDALGGVFQLGPAQGGWAYSIIYTSGTALGAGPGLLLNSSDLYGSIGTGDMHDGAIGELSAGSGGWTYDLLYSFCSSEGCQDGVGLSSPPLSDTKGDLWGTTLYGGIGRPACGTFGGGCGVIYAMTPNGDGTWTYHVVHRFASTPTDGQFPDAGLTLDPEGNFYGETEEGGTHSFGMIFKFSIADGQLKGSAIYNFSNCSIGCYPEGTLAIDKAGNLYGMAQGGPNSCGFSCGVVFKLSPQSNGTAERCHSTV